MWFTGSDLPGYGSQALGWCLRTTGGRSPLGDWHTVGEPVPVRRAGNLVYDYALASEQVPA